MKKKKKNEKFALFKFTLRLLVWFLKIMWFNDEFQVLKIPSD